jgi:hypothetical protein
MESRADPENKERQALRLPRMAARQFVGCQHDRANRDPRHNSAVGSKPTDQFAGKRMSGFVSGPRAKAHAAWIGLLGYGLVKPIELAI